MFNDYNSYVLQTIIKKGTELRCICDVHGVMVCVRDREREVNGQTKALASIMLKKARIRRLAVWVGK